MIYVSTTNALKPSGHYSQAIIYNDINYISAQLAIDSHTGKKQFGTIEEEIERILKNIEMILKAASSDRNYIIKTTAYISDFSLWSMVNMIYSNFFKIHKPARTVVSVNELHYGFKIAIEAIATRPCCLF